MITLTKIFNQYKKFINKIITLIGSIFIYFIGISLGSLILHFSNNKKISNHWQNINLGSDSKVMY